MFGRNGGNESLPALLPNGMVQPLKLARSPVCQHGGAAMSEHYSLVELETTIEYTYDPGEARVLYYGDGSGHPGCPPSVEIDHVWLEKDGQRLDIADFLPTRQIESLAEEILTESCQLS